MTAIYTILLLVYLWGIVICYNACSQDSEFVTLFIDCHPVAAWIIFILILLCWPIATIVYVIQKVFEKEG